MLFIMVIGCILVFYGLVTTFIIVLLASASKTYIASVLFRASALQAPNKQAEYQRLRTFRALVEYSFVPRCRAVLRSHDKY